MRASLQSLLAPFLAFLMLASCSTEADKPAAAARPMTPAQKKEQIEKIRLLFNGPEFIDSSRYVLYPLVLTTIEEEEEGSYSSKSYSRTDLFWNIIFYDTQTGASHLLADNRKTVIYSFGTAKSQTSSGSDAAAELAYQALPKAYQRAQATLCYSVVTDDFNHDGTLDDKDPSYLFVSDKEGRNFRQVSPSGLDVTNWELARGTSKLLIRATQDTNKDKQFAGEDEVIPLVYDLGTNAPATPIFSHDFTTKIKAQLNKYWVKRK